MIKSPRHQSGMNCSWKKSVRTKSFQIVHLLMELTLVCSSSVALSCMSCLRILKFGKQLFKLCYAVKGLRWNQAWLSKSVARGRSEGWYFIIDCRSVPRVSISALEKSFFLSSSKYVSRSQSCRVTRSDSKLSVRQN